MTAIGEAAIDATSMRYRHASRTRGRRPEWLRDAADLNPIHLQEAGNRAKIVVFEAPILGEAAAELYRNKSLYDSFPDESATCIDVLAETLGHISQRNTASEWCDTDLLRRVERFGNVFRKQAVDSVGLGEISDAMSGNGTATLPVVTIDSDTVAAAESLHRQAPAPRPVRIAGKLDMLRDSDRAFDLLLADGTRVRGVWDEDLGPIINLLGKQVVADALAVFRASGLLLRIEAGAMEEASGDDAYFSKVPIPSKTAFNHRAARQPQAANSGLAAVYGRWPGDETEEQLLAALRDLD
ncbi:MAG: hypothetical protein SGJ09_15995 [Phycisphaerae bacterium]|nr:hypothetical protein [Phycisphaerae bacterium]